MTELCASLFNKRPAVLFGFYVIAFLCCDSHFDIKLCVRSVSLMRVAVVVRCFGSFTS